MFWSLIIYTWFTNKFSSKNSIILWLRITSSISSLQTESPQRHARRSCGEAWWHSRPQQSDQGKNHGPNGYICRILYYMMYKSNSYSRWKDQIIITYINLWYWLTQFNYSAVPQWIQHEPSIFMARVPNGAPPRAAGAFGCIWMAAGPQ